jgi:signal transduction histidine kinase
MVMIEQDEIDFGTILGGVSAGIIVQDATGRLLYANDEAATFAGFGSVPEMLALSADELVARFDLVAEDGNPFESAALPTRRVVAGDSPDPVVVGFRPHDGEPERWSLVMARSARLAGGKAGIVSTFHDVTPRIVLERRAQERLAALAAAEHAKAAELDAVIRAMGDGVVVCDRHGRIILANPAGKEIFPGGDESTYEEILAELDDPDRVAPALGRRGGPIELRARRGEERWLEISTWPVGSNGDVDPRHRDETIVMLRDVTEQRQRQAVRDAFIGVLSHELRTPVTTIYAGAKVLSRPGDLAPDTRREIFGDIVVESERLRRLVEDIVAMNRFGDESGEVGSEPVLLQRLLPAVVTSEESRWPGVSFDLNIRPGLPTVIADPTYVEQVVRNLLSNAAKYGGVGTHVDVDVETGGDDVLVHVLDDGPGFPAGESDRLFELFFRSSETTRSVAGAGIGLFVCARLIRAMGGRIWAHNRDGGGAEFGFALRVMTEDG